MKKWIWMALVGLAISACGGTPSLETRDTSVDKDYTGGPVANVLVLSLQEDSVHDSRVVIERGIVQRMKAAGIQAEPGYAVFDSIDELLAKPASFEATLKSKGIVSVLFIEPVRLDTDYDPGEYAARRSAYRALGWDDSAGINALAQLARESSSAKVVLNVGLWVADSDSDVFNTTYDINAPANYDIEIARSYATQFGDIVVEDLRQHGLVN